MKRYSLSNGSYNKSRCFSVHDVNELPSHAKLGVAEFEARENEFYGKEYNFVVYSNKELNKSKLYQLFASLKKQATSAKVALGVQYDR